MEPYDRDRRTALGAAIDMRMLLPQRLSAMLCCSAWPGLVPAISRAVSNSLLPQLPGPEICTQRRWYWHRDEHRQSLRSGLSPKRKPMTKEPQLQRIRASALF